MREQGQLSQTAGGQIICLFKELILKDSSPSNLCIFMNPKVRFYSLRLPQTHREKLTPGCTATLLCDLDTQICFSP